MISSTIFSSSPILYPFGNGLSNLINISGILGFSSNAMFIAVRGEPSLKFKLNSLKKALVSISPIKERTDPTNSSLLIDEL